MTKHSRTDERDEVLLAFHEACSRPTAEQIIEWVEKYPEYAEDIRAHAAVAREWDAAGISEAQADESLLANAYSRALNVIYNSQDKADIGCESFQEIMAARKITVPQVASGIDIDRGIIADLVSGRMSGPIRSVFVCAVTSILSISIEAFNNAHRRALAQPTLGHAKATQAPTIVVRTYDEIIRSCDKLTPTEQRHWLEQDQRGCVD